MELLNLQTIFNEKFFRIPDYQRGYSWGEQQCDDLWRDIEILDDGKDHYTGVLSVVQPQNIPEDCIIPANRLVSVVDGQQRITTLIILINVILNSEFVKDQKWINGKSKDDYKKKYLSVRMGKQGEIIEPVFGYDKDNPSHVYFQEKILGLTPMDNVPAHTLYTRNLEFAKGFFVEKIKELPFDEVEKVLLKVTEQLKFNYYQIDNELNEFIAFETMNNRGKKLSNLELLKNRLIYLSTLLPNNGDEEKKALRHEINEAWKTIYEYLGKSKKPMDDDQFLRDHWIMYFGYGGRGRSKVYREFLLNEYFTAYAVRDNNLNDRLELSDIREYARDIQLAVRSYFFMRNPVRDDCPYSHEVKHWLAKLRRLDYVSFNPLITSILIRYDEIDDSDVIDVLKAAERFYVVALDIRFFPANKSNSDIYRCAHTFHSNQQKLQEIKGELTLDYLGISNDISQEFFCGDIRRRSKKSFYEWKGLNYFLYEYEVYLQESVRGSGEEKLKWEDIKSETIEHVYPQSRANNWGTLFVTEEEQFLLHDLGNLLLLSRKLNSALRDSPFDTKKVEFSNGSYSAIEVSRNSEWTPEVVNERREKLLDFLWERWGLQEPNA